MKLAVDLYSSVLTAVATHGERTIRFTISTYGRNTLKELPDPFYHINQFWASLPEEQQASIFGIYERVENAFMNTLSNDVLFEELSDLVVELMKYHPLATLYYWVTTKSYIQIPEKDLCDEYVHSLERNTSREKTYTKTDYLWLVALALAVRPLVPIWGMYIASIYRQASAKYKEYMAFPLIDRTELRHSEPMEKLLAYISATINPDKINKANILNGISVEDHGFWFMAVVVIRKLSVEALTSSPERENVNLAAMIFKTTNSRTAQGESNFADMVKDKPFESTSESPSGGDDHRKSNAEAYKVSTDISPGEAMEIAHFVHDPYKLIRRFTDDYDPAYLEAALEAAKTRALLISEEHIILIAWVFARVISPVGVRYIQDRNKDSGQRNMIISRCLAVLQTLLHHWGFKYLAIIASSHVNQNTNMLTVNPSSMPAKIKDETYQKLEELYPYRFQTFVKRITDNRAENFAVHAIDLWMEMFNSKSWVATASNDELQDVFGTVNRRISILPQIKEDLANLIIKINEVQLKRVISQPTK